MDCSGRLPIPCVSLAICRLLNCYVILRFPYSDIEHTGLGPIVKHAVKHRRTFPYAHGNFARQSELAGMVRMFADHIRESRRKRK